MKAVCWCGTGRVRVERVPDPSILDPKDAIVKIAVKTICGSDLHIYGGHIATMQRGDIIGHEIVGEVVETGSDVKKINKGDRVVVSSMISCGNCWHCKRQEFSLCDNTNPNAALQDRVLAMRPAASSAIRTCSAVTPARKRNSSACRLPTSAPSSCLRE